jgi:uroporphyrinogen decarboxylase
MTPKERVMMSIAHKQPDKIPFDIGFTQKARQKMAAYMGRADFDKDWERFLLAVNLAPPHEMQEIAPGIVRDEWGVHWNRTQDKDIGVVCNVRVTPDNILAYVTPDPTLPERYGTLERIRESGSERYVMGSIGFSLFERAWTLAGMENVFMAMLTDKPFVNQLLDKILEYNLAVIDKACSYPVDAMRFGDDWGGQNGLLMGPDLWREFIGPRVQQMYARVKSHGKQVIIHSCGKVEEIFPDLMEYGLDVFNPFQPEVIDVYEAKRQYGKHLTFYGGISTQRLLPYGTPAQVRTEVRRLLEEVGEQGGLIAAPAHSIPGDAQPANILAMVETLHDQ